MSHVLQSWTTDKDKNISSDASHCWIKLLKARAYHGGIHLRSQ